MFKPVSTDYNTIGFYTGKIIVGIGLLMLIPLFTAGLFGEWSVVIDIDTWIIPEVFSVVVQKLTAAGYVVSVLSKELHQQLVVLQHFLLVVRSPSKVL